MSNPFPKRLPLGTFVRLENLPFDTTEQEIADVFRSRAGIVIPVERIAMSDGLRHERAAMISFDNPTIVSLLNWAFSQDTVNGSPLDFHTYSPRHVIKPPVRYAGPAIETR